MSDIVSPAIRSQMMAGIKSKNTRPELALRKVLHRMGFRYRLHDKRFPGTPDMVFPKYNAVVFIQGCFWHHHDCKLFKWPSTNAEFWQDKINSNVDRDKRNIIKIREMGWRIGIVWECSVKRRDNSVNIVTIRIADWLNSESVFLEIGS